MNQNLSFELRQIILEQYIQLHDLVCFAGGMNLFQMASLNAIFHAVLTDCNY